MYCSSCGQKLGGVAHVFGNELLCENCFMKLGQTQVSNQQHAVLLSQVSEEERTSASQAIPPENVPEVNLPTNQASMNAPPAPQRPASISSPILLGGEQILWKRTFSKGIIHREATLSEVITNLRVLCIDDETKSIVRAVPLSSASVAVTNTKRDYTNVHTGFERYGAYSGVGKGTGVTIGNVDFFLQGKLVLSLTNIRDPFGLKRMIDSSVKSSR